MTNPQLKAHCEDVIANPQDHLDWVVDMARVTLASLEAEPVGYIHNIVNPKDVGVGRLFAEENRHYARAIYTAPLVPELKLPDVSEGDPGKLHDVRTRHDFSNGFRFAIEEVKRLNGVKS